MKSFFIFWENKGSVVFLAEDIPLCYQVNLCLENAVFPGFGKVQFRIRGEHKGGQTLKEDNTGTLINKHSYNSKLKITMKNEFVKKSITKPSIGFKMGKKYEGDTIFCM